MYNELRIRLVLLVGLVVCIILGVVTMAIRDFSGNSASFNHIPASLRIEIRGGIEL